MEACRWVSAAFKGYAIVLYNNILNILLTLHKIGQVILTAPFLLLFYFRKQLPDFCEGVFSCRKHHAVGAPVRHNIKLWVKQNPLRVQRVNYYFQRPGFRTCWRI
jgi:hypothetical protein